MLLSDLVFPLYGKDDINMLYLFCIVSSSDYGEGVGGGEYSNNNLNVSV